MGRPLAELALILSFCLSLAACATGPGGPDERTGPPGRGRGVPGMGQPYPSGAEAGWKAYDLNGDGKVTRAEFSAVRNLCFVRYDANGDGVLSGTEVRRLLLTGLTERHNAVFSRMDRDGDGQISREEYDQENDRLFRFVDTNGDGVIAGMEVSNLTSVLLGHICQPSGSPESDEGRRASTPTGGPGPRGRR